ncbi:MAG: hypothetical protein D6762_01220, partial [Candidatus Neomarinimicrobiota bacterium]
DGTVLAASHADPATMDSHRDRPEVRDALRTGAGQSHRYSYTLKEPFWYRAVRIDTPAPAILRAAVPDPSLPPLRWEATTVGMGILLLLAGGLLMLYFERRDTRVREEIRRGIQAVAAGRQPPELSPRLPEPWQRLGTSIDDLNRDFQEVLRRRDREREELETVLENLEEGIVVLDDSLRVVRLNARAESLLQMTGSNWKGKRFPEWIRQPRLLESLNGAAPPSGELELEGSPPRTVAFHHAPFRIASTGEAYRLLVLRDITEARATLRMRQDFVANVSHELKTPLTSLKGYAETLQEELPPSAEPHTFLRAILRQTERMQALVEDLLTLSHLDHAGAGSAAAREPVSVSRSWEAARQEVAEAGDRKGLQWELSLPEEDTLIGDEEWLKRAWINLLDNAVKYSPPGGRIRITGRRQEDTLVIRVEDSGPGIPPEHRERVWERFYRVDPGRDRKTGGTGLGLAIVKHIIQLHGGQVSAGDSSLGGCGIEIRLPVRAD